VEAFTASALKFLGLGFKSTAPFYQQKSVLNSARFQNTPKENFNSRSFSQKKLKKM
jgi:hypothetical protein